MEYNHRINSRNELKELLIHSKIITFKDNKPFQLPKNILQKKIKNDIELKNSYFQYVSEFRTEDEAIYCLLHNDDFEDHKCPVCNNICKFDKHIKKYLKTCGNKKCISFFCNSDEMQTKPLLSFNSAAES